MIRRLPVVPTIVVAILLALMVGFGFFELHRAGESRQWLAEYRSNSKLPPIAYPATPTDPLPLFRWASGFCQRVVGHRAIGGRNGKGDVGWVHIVDCATGAEGRGMSVEVGWSEDPNAPVNWSGGPVSGVIVRDRVHRIRLVAATAPPGLQPAGLPSVEDAVPVTPGRATLYAIQWFSFAIIALIIYGLAVRKHLKQEPVKK
jgi:hypothetical protein